MYKLAVYPGWASRRVQSMQSGWVVVGMQLNTLKFWVAQSVSRRTKLDETGTAPASLALTGSLWLLPPIGVFQSLLPFLSISLQKYTRNVSKHKIAMHPCRRGPVASGILLRGSSGQA